MKTLLSKEKISLVPNAKIEFEILANISSNQLLYEIIYHLADETKIIFAELIGSGTSKISQIGLNTNKGIKTGEFNSQSILSNINFIVESIRFYSASDLDIELSIYKNELIHKD